MNVQTSKCLVGLKAAHIHHTGRHLLKNELTINLLLDLLFGKALVCMRNYTQMG